MSLVLMVVYWVVIPVGIFKLARWLFLRTGSPVVKGIVAMVTVGFYAWFLWIAVGRNLWLDQQVREMCANDGGIKVYETVTLPADQFDKYDQLRVPFKKYAKPEDKYFFESASRDIQIGNPAIWRNHFIIIRRDDGKAMGEAISYARRGGGLPGPWHSSSFRCPKDADTGDLIKQLFIKAK